MVFTWINNNIVVFILQFVFADATGHFKVGVYTNVLMDLYEMGDHSAAPNVNTLTNTLEQIRFSFFHMYLKLDLPVICNICLLYCRSL